jgi:hypothetical protein
MATETGLTEIHPPSPSCWIDDTDRFSELDLANDLTDLGARRTFAA